MLPKTSTGHAPRTRIESAAASLNNNPPDEKTADQRPAAASRCPIRFSSAGLVINTFPEPTEFEKTGRSLEPKVQRIRSIAFSRDGHRLAVAHGDYRSDGAVRVWDLPQKKEIALWEEPKGIYSVHISPDGRLVAYSSLSDKLVRVRNVRSGEEMIKIATGDEPARVRFSPDGTTWTAESGYRWEGGKAASALDVDDEVWLMVVTRED